MISLILRLLKGAPLTHAELDGNFVNLRNGTLHAVVANVGPQNVTAQRAVAMTAAGLVHADASIPLHAGKVVGVALDGGAPGQMVRVATSGLIAFSAVTPGAVYFLAADGLLTDAVPTSGFQQEIAVATSGSELSIGLGAPIVLSGD